MSQPDVIQSAAKFLQTPAKPERRLEEKIRFLIYEKKLTQYQLIEALKQANLYSIETIEPILTMCYYEQNLKQKSKPKSKRTSKIQQSQPIPTQQQAALHPQSTSSSSSSWWRTLSTVGIGVASFIASYTASTTASQNVANRVEQTTTAKIDTVKREIKEQADLDRERQHRDLMEVVSLLKTQVQCVQQNLGVLKQSIDVIQTQMKYNNMGNNIDVTQHKNIRTSTSGDDGSIISSVISTQNEIKPSLGVIGNLLSANDDGLDWLNTDIERIHKEEKQEHQDDESTSVDRKIENTTHEDGHKDKDKDKNKEMETEMDELEMEVIYHPDYKDMIKTLPTDIVEIKQQLTDLLRMWQRMVVNKEQELTVDKIKAGFNSLNFYINKILKKPFMEQTRKINTYNKQYKERLSTLPRIDTLLTLIGYEKDNVFWTLPLLYKETNESINDEQSKEFHDRQIEFLRAFKEVLTNLFNIDGALPFTLSQSIMNIKQEREDENKEKQKEKEKETEKIKEKEKEKERQDEINTLNRTPDTQYSNKFMEIAKLVSEGKKPDDVEVIDDMPPDPNAPPSESKMVQPQKPFEIDTATHMNEQTWFEQYEAQQNDNAQTAEDKAEDATEIKDGGTDNKNDENTNITTQPNDNSVHNIDVQHDSSV